MIIRAYRAVEAAWKRVLDSRAGVIFHAPVEWTFNECGVCHWWRGAALGTAMGFMLSGRFVIASVIAFGVMLLVGGQRVVDDGVRDEDQRSDG